MHIGQFSLVICSFVAAITAFFVWPHEPSGFIALIPLIASLCVFTLARRGNNIYLARIGWILLAAALGFSWAQGRTHLQAAQSGAI